jgi:hypothetical protein
MLSVEANRYTFVSAFRAELVPQCRIRFESIVDLVKTAIHQGAYRCVDHSVRCWLNDVPHRPEFCTHTATLVVPLFESTMRVEDSMQSVVLTSALDSKRSNRYIRRAHSQYRICCQMLLEALEECHACTMYREVPKSDESSSSNPDDRLVHRQSAWLWWQ